ncbi:haloacid dehalogenase type II [Nocardia asteroides]|uniref:haloacid dehalogenase type II n=1 Tax=Nocardia asteroides TaxID=1824 RepID=UPI001E4459CA|nr:haloacid dehalogenase type II [Nocardia asteroides]UGT56970.1 haloacid dehalogenase type II [Nocardia asteroides]
MHSAQRVDALLFDVQGTATDFHSTVCRTAQDLAEDRFPDYDWSDLVNRWRQAYFQETSQPRTAVDPWDSVVGIYRHTLDDLLDADGIGFSAVERDRLTDAWSRLEPWPDVLAGLRRLGTRFTLATLSNADVSAVVGITRHGRLPWHATFAAEMAGVFKPDPAIYAMAARYLGTAPERIMMVASHKYDIRAAGALGFRTAFVARPLEFGAGNAADTDFSDEFDINATDFGDLADQLGC